MRQKDCFHKVFSFFFLCLLLLSMLPFYSPIVSAMSTYTLHPTANGSHIELSLGGAGSSTNWVNVLSDNVSCVYGATMGAPPVNPYDVYVFGNISDTTLTVLNLTFRGTFNKDVGSTGSANYTVLTHGTYYNLTGFSIVHTGAGATLFTNREWHNTTITTNPFTGIAWTVSEVNDAQFGLRLVCAVGNTYCFYMYADAYCTIAAPTGLIATRVNATKISLTWTPGTGFNTTVRYKLGSNPTGATDGTSAYNGSGSSVVVSGLTPSKHYYFKAWSYTSVYGLSYANVTDDEWTSPEKPTNLGLKLTTLTTTVCVNMSWTNGTGGTRTLIRGSNTTQPLLPTNGYTVSNQTGKPYKNVTGLNHPEYFTIFAYNSTTHLYSVGLNCTWHVVWVTCKNETSLVNISSYSLFITNDDGSSTYSKTGCGNPTTINSSLCPSGSHIAIQVSKTGYSTSTFYQDIDSSTNVYINAYLSHLASPPPAGNGSYLYQLTIINEGSITIPDVQVTVKGIIGGAYVNIFDTYSDGNGQFSVYLIPDRMYKILLTKTGYDNSTNDYIPSASILTHTLQMVYSASTIPSYIWGEQIIFTATQNNVTKIITVHYVDALVNTTNWQVYIYRINANSSSTLLTSYSGTNDSFYLYYNTTNNTWDYRVLLRVNHTYFGYATDQTTIYGYHGGFMRGKATKFNLLMTLNFGWCPFGWSNVVGLFFIIVCLFSFGRRETYLSALLIGVILLFLDIYIGFPTVWNALAGGAFPIIVIFIGVLMMIRDRGNFGAS